MRIFTVYIYISLIDTCTASRIRISLFTGYASPTQRWRSLISRGRDRSRANAREKREISALKRPRDTPRGADTTANAIYLQNPTNVHVLAARYIIALLSGRKR